MRSGRRTASRWKAWSPPVAGKISKPRLPRAAPATWMLDSWSSTTSRQPVLVSNTGAFIWNLCGLQLGLDGRGFDGLDQLGERGEMTFHLPDGVGVGERNERGGIRRKRGALGRLAEGEKVVRKGARLI